MVPGVTVGPHYELQGIARIGFTVVPEESALAIQRAATGANVPIIPWERGPLVPGHYELVASMQEHDGFSELQVLGIHVTWHLYRVGLLSSDQANSRLRRWRATEVVA